jgi:hypothetical protein
MIYGHSLRLFFHPEVFLKPNQPHPQDTQIANAPISLTYSPTDGNADLSTEKRFFLQLIQSHIHSLPQSSTSTKDLLEFISDAWAIAGKVSKEIKSLNLNGLTCAEILGDDVLGIRTMVIVDGSELPSRVDVAFKLHVTVTEKGVSDVDVKSNAQVVYGGLSAGNSLANSFRSEVGKRSEQMGGGRWAAAVRSVILTEAVDNTATPVAEKKSLLRPGKGNQTPAPARKTPARAPNTEKGRKVLAGMSENVNVISASVSSLPTGSGKLQPKSPMKSPARKTRTAAYSPAKTGSPLKTPPRTKGQVVKDLDEFAPIGGEEMEIVGMGIDANGLASPVKLRKGGIPRTPPQVVRDV